MYGLNIELDLWTITTCCSLSASFSSVDWGLGYAGLGKLYEETGLNAQRHERCGNSINLVLRYMFEDGRRQVPRER